MNKTLSWNIHKFASLWRVKASALLTILFVCLASCSTNPVTGARQFNVVSESWELKTGEQHYPFQQQAGGGRYVIDPDLTAYVSSVGRKIVPFSKRKHLPYEFVVLNDSSPNAWALPGGKIAINRGLLLALKNEAELAAVLAHEVVHADAGHSAQAQSVGTLIQIGQTAAGIALDKSGASSTLLQQGVGFAGLYGQTRHSRSKELEADLYGMRYMSAAGYDPRAAISLQETFVRLSAGRSSDLFSLLFASHPPSQSRVAANQKTAWSLPRSGQFGEAAYAREIAKLKARKPAYDASDEAVKSIGKKDFHAALALADKAIQLERRESRFHEIRGFALQGLNRSKDAKEAYTQAINLDPSYFSPLLRRGILNHKLQSFSDARLDLNASLKLAPSQIAHFVLGDIEEKNRRCQTAANHFQFAAQNPGEYQQQAQQRLAALQLNCKS